MSQNEQKNGLPELPGIKLSNGVWICWIAGGLVVLGALCCFGWMLVRELGRNTSLLEAENRSGVLNYSDSLCIHWENALDEQVASELETGKQDTVVIGKNVCHANICQADTLGNRNYSHDYSLDRYRRSHIIFAWKNYLLILLGGAFCFGLVVLFFRAFMAFRAERVKVTDLWRKCYMERFNYELEELKRTGAEEERREWEEKQKQTDQQNKMEFFRLLALMQEGKKITPETLKQLEKEYQEIKKLMDNSL